LHDGALLGFERLWQIQKRRRDADLSDIVQ
jgi:hypothetical protein